MTAPEGLSLIERWNGPLSGDDRGIALALGNEVGWLPLALNLMAAGAKTAGWASYRELWRNQRLTALKRGRRGTGPQDNVADSFDLSYARLKDDADLYKRLAVFGANTLFPVSAGAALWNMSEAEARELLADFAKQALVISVGPPPDSRYMLHSLLHEFLVKRLGADLAATHSALVDGYRRRSQDGWAGVPDDGYFGDRVVFHLVEAGRIREVWDLLDRPWMEARFKRGMSHVSFLADLRAGMQTARREPVDIAAFIRCAVIYMTVSAFASSDPPNMPAALAELGDIDIALNRAATMSGANARVQAYIAIAGVLLERNRTGEALVAAERAVAVANAEVEGYRGIEMLAKAATCLGRCGRDTSEMLARARALALSAAGEEKPVRIEALAAVIDGYAALGRPAAVADIVKQMMEMITAADPDDSRLMIVGASRAFKAIGAVEPLRALLGPAVAHVRDGLGGYQLESVAVALAACGDFETAVSAARQIPEAYATIEAFSEIAEMLARENRRDEAVELFREALALFERDLEMTDGSGWHYSEHLLSAAHVLGTVASLESVIRNGAPKDAVWHSWLLAGLARVLNRGGADEARVGAIARQSHAVLREALTKRPGGIHREQERAGVAGLLAEAGAVAEAVSVADDIDDVRYRKEALTAIAVQLWRSERTNDARALLLRALVTGLPDAATRIESLGSLAKTLARLGDSTLALDTIESCLQLLATLDSGSAEQIGARAVAVEVFELCGQAERARDLAGQAVELLGRRRGPFILNPAFRSRVVYLAAKAGAVEALELSLANSNWYYRRTIAAGVVRGFNAIGQPERGRRFFDDLESDKQGVSPWNETAKVDALARLFALRDEPVRRWVLETADSIRSPWDRAVLAAKCASALVSEDVVRAAQLARSAIDVANRIDDPAQREKLSIQLAGSYARACARDQVVEALAGVENPGAKDEAFGELAMALVRRGHTADATAALRSMAPGSTKNYWTLTVADVLLDARQYDAAREIYGPFNGWPAGVDREYAVVHTALALARDGEHVRAQAMIDEVMARVETWRQETGDFSWVTSELALCFACLGSPGRAVELADRARQYGRDRWVPFVSATSAAACAVAGDRDRARTAAAETLQQLLRLSHASLIDSVHAIARIWTGVGGFDGFELLLSTVGEIQDEWTRGSAIGQALRGAGAALTPARFNSTIDRASAIEDEWIRLSAMQAIVEIAAARGDRTALASLLQMTSAFDNDWAASDLVVALAAAAASLGDDDLLKQTLTWTSGQRTTSWNAVAVVAEAARVVLERGDHQRADTLIRRALESGANELRYEDRDRATHDAHTVPCLSLLGRHSEAADALDRVIDAVLKTPVGYDKDTVLSPLESALDDLEPSAIAKVAEALLSTSPRIAAAAALALARLGRTADAARLVDRVAARATAADPADRSSILFLCAQTLAALNQTDDGVRCALDALDVARTLESSYHGSIVGFLAEALADLRLDDAVEALRDALVTTGAWWAREGG